MALLALLSLGLVIGTSGHGRLAVPFLVPLLPGGLLVALVDAGLGFAWRLQSHPAELIAVSFVASCTVYATLAQLRGATRSELIWLGIVLWVAFTAAIVQNWPLCILLAPDRGLDYLSAYGRLALLAPLDPSYGRSKRTALTLAAVLTLGVLMRFATSALARRLAALRAGV